MMMHKALFLLALIWLPIEFLNEEVYFSPPSIGQEISAEKAIIQTLNEATYSIQVQAYSFTSMPITKALVEAKDKGLRVRVLIDDSSVKTLASQYLLKKGVDIRVDSAHAIAHNKIIILDEQLVDKITVITGSYNFSDAANTRNAENFRIRRRDPLGSAYVANWYQHLKHSTPLGQ